MQLDARIYGLNPIAVQTAKVLVLNGKRCDIVDFGPLDEKNRIFCVELSRLKVSVYTREKAPDHRIKFAIVTDPTRPKLDILAAMQGGVIVRPCWIVGAFPSCPFAKELGLLLDGHKRIEQHSRARLDLLKMEVAPT